MEYIEESLQDRMNRQIHFPEITAFKLFYQLVDALEKFHKLDFIHRNIKPSNIMLKKIGAATYVNLIDFSLT